MSRFGIAVYGVVLVVLSFACGDLGEEDPVNSQTDERATSEPTRPSVTSDSIEIEAVLYVLNSTADEEELEITPDAVAFWHYDYIGGELTQNCRGESNDWAALMEVVDERFDALESSYPRSAGTDYVPEVIVRKNDGTQQSVKLLGSRPGAPAYVTEELFPTVLSFKARATECEPPSDERGALTMAGVQLFDEQVTADDQPGPRRTISIRVLGERVTMAERELQQALIETRFCQGTLPASLIAELRELLGIETEFSNLEHDIYPAGASHGSWSSTIYFANYRHAEQQHIAVIDNPELGEPPEILSQQVKPFMESLSAYATNCWDIRMPTN